MTRNALMGSGILIALWSGAAAMQHARPPEPRVDAPLPVARPVPPKAAAVQPAAPKRPPALRVQVTPERPPESLAVTRAEVDVVITGYVAQTTVTLTFRNPHPRILEGELVFPLPEGAAVSGLRPRRGRRDRGWRAGGEAGRARRVRDRGPPRRRPRARGVGPGQHVPHTRVAHPGRAAPAP